MLVTQDNTHGLEEAAAEVRNAMECRRLLLLVVLGLAMATIPAGLTGESETPAGRLGELLARAGSSTAKERAGALRSLAAFQTAQAVDALVAGCRDEHWNVRVTALRSLKKAGHSRGISAAMAALSDEVPEVRVAAVRLLGTHKSEQVVGAVIRCCDDSDYDVRRFAVRALREIGDKRGLDVARRMLADKYPSVRKEGCETVSALAEDEAAVWLEIYRGAENGSVKALALRACARLDVHTVAAEIRAAAQSDLEQMRAACVQGLARLATSDDLKALDSLVRDRATIVRLAAVSACFLLEGEARGRMLGKLIFDSHDGVRLRCLSYLQHKALPEDCSLLLKAIEIEEVASLRALAIRAIAGSAGADVVPKLKALAEEEEKGKEPSALTKAVADIERRKGIAGPRP